MLSSKTRKRILDHKWGKHSNTSLFINRIKKCCDGAFEDLAIIANEFEKPQIEKFFTEAKLKPFIVALLRSRLDLNRKFLINHMLLKATLENTEKLVENELLKEQYKQHKTELKKIIDSIYREKQTILGNEPRLTDLHYKSKRQK